MSALDWLVLAGALAGFVAYGLWRGRGNRDLRGYLLADRDLRWGTVALSIMATQASAVTFLSTTGQGYADGMRFVQFYLGLPLAMVVLSITAVPIYHRLRVFTAYEYLEGRFDLKTRTLAAGLFLLQRGLAAGITIYAPSLVLSVLLGWNIHLTILAIGGLVILYTASGGARAVGHTHVLQFSIILGSMAVALVLILRALPHDVSLVDAVRVAGRMGRMNVIDFQFDPRNRYNFWSGLIGGFFLALSYFGTDQSQVARYLTGRSVTASRLGLLFNGLAKVPMQFAVLFVGVMVLVFYQFVPPPLFFNPVEVQRVEAGPRAAQYRDIEARHRAVFETKARSARQWIEASRAGDPAAMAAAGQALDASRHEAAEVRSEAVALIQSDHRGAQTNDTNYIFLSFVLHHLPIGIVGLVLAAIFAASMNSSSSEISSLASTTIVDVNKRLFGLAGGDRMELLASRMATVFWGGFALAFAEYAGRLGSLIEAVNILGSLFYGTILGIFLVAFYLPRVGGTAVFIAALLAEAAVIYCFASTRLAFLWYNVVGCLLVVLLALALSLFLRNETAHAPATQAG
jgi:SSS family solute:Na+ symporter